MGFLPTALAIALVIVMIHAGAPTAPLTISRVSEAASALGVGGSTVIVVIAGAVSITLQPLQYRLVQWLEGYWSLEPRGLLRLFRIVRVLYRFGLWRQRRRYRRTVSAIVVDRGEDPRIGFARSRTAAEARRLRFPAANRLLPTTLGNVLRSAEDRAGVRYGIDSVTLWPRLHALLPDDFAAGIEDEVTQLDISVRMAITWLTAGFVGAVLLAAHPHGALRHPGWIGIIAAMFLLAQLSYRGAIESALAHGRDIEIAIDLFRNRVLDNARMPEPDRLSKERTTFGRLIELYSSYSATQPDELIYRPTA